MKVTPQIAAVAGFVIGVVLGWLFFHDPGDGIVGTTIAAGLWGAAFAVAGYVLARRPTAPGRSRGSR